MALSHDAFAKRESSLENEFFYRVDKELIERLKNKAHELEGRERLAQVTGISDGAVITELLEEGIRAESLVAISLVPLIWVAFADRTVDAREREALLKAAETVGVTSDTASHELFSSWLERKPEEKLFEVWRHYVQAMKPITSPTLFRQLEETTCRRAHEIAKAAGGFLGIHSISDAEQGVIDEIERTFRELPETSVE